MRMPLPTRLFGALLLSTSSRFETRPEPTRLEFEIFFFDRRLSPSRPILLFRIRNDITTLSWKLLTAMKNEEKKEIMQFFQCFLLNAIKNEENKGNNVIFWMFLVERHEKWRKCKEIMQFFDFVLLNAIKNEEKKGNNASFWMFLVECDEKWRQ